jgi:hypothetical protein
MSVELVQKRRRRKHRAVVQSPPTPPEPSLPSPGSSPLRREDEDQDPPSSVEQPNTTSCTSTAIVGKMFDVKARFVDVPLVGMPLVHDRNLGETEYGFVGTHRKRILS